MTTNLPAQWDVDVDVVVLGSGAAGLTAAAAAQVHGARVALLEKTDKWGGTTAVSSAGTWMPRNHHMADLGISDSREEVVTYMKRLGAVKGDWPLIETFIDVGPEAIRFLEEKTPTRFQAIRYPDYHPEFEGGKSAGRPLEPALFDLKPLGELGDRLEEEVRLSAMALLPIMMCELSVGLENLDFQMLFERHNNGLRSGGRALIMPLIQHCVQQGVELHLKTRGRELITENGAVVGVRAEKDGRDFFVRARQGVVIATGGFEWNEDLAKAFLRGPMEAPSSPPACEGDGLLMAQQVGAALGNMSEAWWMPTYNIPGEEYDGKPLNRIIARERCLPGCIFVNRQGRRFVNEAHNYNDIGRSFHTFDPVEFDFPNVPAWMLFDHTCKSTYIMATVMPHRPSPSWMTKADSLRELAQIVGIDPDGLEASVAKFNTHAREGQDPEFKRGVSVYDHHNADPNHKPNPALAPLETPPYYAIRIYPGTLGTKGGAKTNERAQVLDIWGKTIPGLYAAGNSMAGVTGMAYAGAGGTIGPAIAFGYLAGQYAAQEPKR
ncbi:MAG: FAD-dependent oxidoreductase [Chloroflexota bacterium]|nr:MAG: FAD-dependent oxidoreductase [Chloroflexota bacterium]